SRRAGAVPNNSRSIGQNCSRSPRLNSGSIAVTRATNLSRTSSATRRESRPPISQFGRNRQTHETRRPTGGGVGLDGKVVVVTGGTGYLGSSVCKAFAETGATVVSVYLLDREIPYFEKVLGALGKKIGRASCRERGEISVVAV